MNELLDKPRSRGDAIQMLFAHHKKEQLERQGYTAFIHPGIFPTDDSYQVWTMPKGACQ